MQFWYYNTTRRNQELPDRKGFVCATQNSRRWILITDAVTNPSYTNSTILIAVSATNDPTGIWHMYAIAVDPTGTSWMDFPNLGYNNKWICVTGNMFPNSTGGASGCLSFCLFDYASIMAGTSAPSFQE
jgi:hypothetical protein